jgi:hypothetical protein
VFVVLSMDRTAYLLSNVIELGYFETSTSDYTLTGTKQPEIIGVRSLLNTFQKPKGVFLLQKV